MTNEHAHKVIHTLKHSSRWNRRLKVHGIIQRRNGQCVIQCSSKKTDRAFTLSRNFETDGAFADHVEDKIEKANDLTEKPKLTTSHGKVVTQP